MPTRTKTQVRNVTLQLHLPGKDEAPAEIIEGRGKNQRRVPISPAELQQAVIRTHVITNLLTAYYAGRMRWMLAQGETGTAAGRAARNVVSAIVGTDGNATKASNASRSKYGPLTDPESDGDGLAAARENASDVALRIKLLNELAVNPSAIEREEVRKVFAPTGRIPSFLVESQAPSGVSPASPWNEERQAKLMERISERLPAAAGTNPIVDLFHAGWLSADSPFRSKAYQELLGEMPGVSAELGFGTFALAATRLATDAAWRKRRKEEREKQQKALTEEFADRNSREWKALTEYEESAGRRHDEVSGNVSRAKYQLGDGGELKGWSRIRREWLKLRWRVSGSPTEEELRTARLALQKLRPEEVGDHALFDWLAAESQWFLWDGCAESDPQLRASTTHDHVSRRARFSRMSRPLKGIDWTWPDPLRHPLWTQYGDDGGSNNLPWRNLVPAGADRGVTLQLIFRKPNGSYVGREVRLRVGENRRLAPLSDRPGWVMLDGEIPAEVGGGKLLLRRSTLEKAARSFSPELRRLLVQPDTVTPERVERLVAAIQSAPAARHRRALAAYLSIALSVEAPLPPECLPLKKEAFAFNKKEAEIGFLPRYANPATVKSAAIQALPLRVLGVDLGLRHAACFSIVELRKKKDAGAGPHRELPDGEGLVAAFTHRGQLHVEGDRAEDAPVPIRLERADRALSFALRAVDRQRRCASALRRAQRCATGTLDSTELQKERGRLEREVATLFPNPDSPARVSELSWASALESLAPVLEAFPRSRCVA